MDYRNPEHDTLECLARLLPAVDSARAGYCIDVGGGTGNWYWLSFDNWRYQTLCIDAQPTQPLITALQQYQVPLLSAALNDTNGLANLHVGRGGDVNLCGLEPTAWGADSVTIPVSGVTYQGVLRQHGIAKVTCLKLDIEGAEYRVIRSLTSVPADQLPSVLTFEYGGGSSRRDGAWAWTGDGLARLDGIFADLHAMGYTQVAAFDAAQIPQLTAIDYPYRQVVDALFSDVAEWGNCIAVRNVDLGAYL